MSSDMHIRFWGVRGTLPTTGADKAEYGGRTSCVELVCGEHTIIFDAGTGLAVLEKRFSHADILLSHTHIDHILGAPFFLADCTADKSVALWAGHLKPEMDCKSALARLMSSPIFPIGLDGLRIRPQFHDFAAGETISTPTWQKAGITVRTHALNHPDRATGYRVEFKGRSVCYITDYEHAEGTLDAALVDFIRGADVFIFDATYCDLNYARYRGWGHSTWQQGARLAEAAGVGRYVAFHHDPYSDDATLRTREAKLRNLRAGSMFAKEGLSISLLPEVVVQEREATQFTDIDDAVKLVDRLTSVGVLLSEEDDSDAVLNIILQESQRLANADGGTIYLLKDYALHFAIVHNDKLGIFFGGKGADKPPFAPLPLDAENSDRTLATYAVTQGMPVNIADAYRAEGFDFEGAKRFDAQHQYRTQSVLAIPMINQKKQVMGCLQLVNARDGQGNLVPFSCAVQQLVMSLASQASVILYNKMLLQGQKDLLEAFIKMIAQAIDAKSPYTGEHCERVPVLTNMIAQAACEATEGDLKDFSMTPEEKYELHIAGWMHDCGKVTTPVHIMDKSTKLETISDRIALVRTRFELMKRDARIAMLEAMQKDGADKAALESNYAARVAALDDDFAFIAKANVGGEFMSDADLERLKQIAAQRWVDHGKEEPALSENELYNLSIRRGTLTNEERDIMNGHMVHTCAMLEALPFPEHLKRVPEYAGGHHERMDGKGYPKGIKAGDMSIPARMMAVADVFEALTANDRPYKQAKKLSEAMGIIGMMKRDHHLDPMIVDFFVSSKVYLQFAKRYLDESLIDAVDEAALLAIKPK